MQHLSARLEKKGGAEESGPEKGLMRAKGSTVNYRDAGLRRGRCPVQASLFLWVEQSWMIYYVLNI